LWYRNCLAHNAVLAPGTCLTLEDGEPFEFAENGEPVKIRLAGFYEVVDSAWHRFDKTFVNPSLPDSRKMPVSNVDLFKQWTSNPSLLAGSSPASAFSSAATPETPKASRVLPSK
jgi:hypothetical protein